MGFLAGRFAKQAQGAEGSVFKPELLGEGGFERLSWPAGAFAMGGEPLKSGGWQLAERQLVGRFWPDQFGNKQSEAHGERGQAGRGRRKSVP